MFVQSLTLANFAAYIHENQLSYLVLNHNYKLSDSLLQVDIGNKIENIINVSKS